MKRLLEEMDKNGVWQWPGDVVEDKQLPIKAAVALAVIKNAEKQRNAIGTKATSAVFSTCSAGGAISTCSTTCSLPSGEATTTSSTEACGVRRRLGYISSSRSSTGTQTHRSMAPPKPTKNGYKA